MRGHLLQGPSLDCQSGDLPGGGAPPPSAYPHTGLPSCSTPDQAFHFPTPLAHSPRTPCPCDGCPLTPPGWGQAAPVSRPSLGWGAVPVALPTFQALLPSHPSPRHPPPTTSDSADANSIPVGLHMREHPLTQWQGGHPPPVPHAPSSWGPQQAVEQSLQQRRG